MLFLFTPSIAQWKYKTTEDKMRGTNIHYAELKSINRAQLDFPYRGGSALELILRHKESTEEPDAILILDRGQIPCSIDCNVFVKFDSGEVEKLGGSGGESGRSDLIFIGNSKEFIERLRLAKRLIVEVSIFGHGRFQFIFNVAGLNWKSAQSHLLKEALETQRIEITNKERIEYEFRSMCEMNRNNILEEAKHYIDKLYIDITSAYVKEVKIELAPDKKLSLSDCPPDFINHLALDINEERRRLFQLFCVDRKNQRLREALSDGYHRNYRVCGADYMQKIIPWSNYLSAQQQVYQERSKNPELWDCRIWRDYTIFGDKATKIYWGKVFESKCSDLKGQLD
jgi:hypothetical protein